MKKFILSLTAYCFVFLLPACEFSDDKSEKDFLDGKWISADTGFGVDGYLIDTAKDTLTYYYAAGTLNWTDDQIILKGKIVNNSTLSKTSGAITIKIDTASPAYQIIRWQNADGKKISLANAFKMDGKNLCGSAEEAEKEQTIENGYFTFFGDYTVTE